jgi:hypothetical protein
VLIALKNHPTLEKIGFARCELHNVAVLKIILEGCKTIKLLTICMEDLKSDSIDILADFISSNHPVETLELKGDDISDNDTVLLASALKKNTNLIQCDLSGNDITEVGQKNILKALYDPTSMGSLVESNHKCIPYSYDIINESILEQRPPLEIEIISINIDDDMSIQRKIREKVVLALCGMDGGLFDLSYFNDLTLQLMPRVLELIQKHTDARTRQSNEMQLEKDTLSRIFHTLRGWELPSLFVNLNNPSANVTTGKRKRRKTRRY